MTQRLRGITLYRAQKKSDSVIHATQIMPGTNDATASRDCVDAELR
jgi:hypothetical protein